VHIASFFAFPFFFLTIVSFKVGKYFLDKDSVSLGAGRMMVSFIVLLGVSYLLFRVGRFLLRLLFRVSLFRFPITRKGFIVLTVCYALFTCMISYIPPMLAIHNPGADLPFTCDPSGSEPGQRPNILLLVLDTARADHLSCYGYPKPTTPNIDRMAREGVLFENAYSAAVWTLAGHASIFTGMTPSKNGANGENIYLDEGFITLAEVLANCGYRTAGFCNNPWVSEFTATDQGFHHFRKMWLKQYGQNLLLSYGFYRLIQNLFTSVPIVGSVEATTGEVLDWMKEHEDEPYFVFINLMEPHPPLDYRAEFTDPFIPEGLSPEDLKAVNQNPYTIWAGKESMDSRDFQAYQALYDGELRYMDFHLGKFFDELQAAGLLDSTLLIITADHGEQMGEGGYLGHHFALRDALIHVPLIVRGPNVVPLGVRVTSNVQTLDILPTLIGLLGIQDLDIWNALQGKSLLPLPAAEEERSVVAEEYRALLEIKFVDAYKPEFDVDDVYGHRSRAWIKGPYKYVAHEEGAEEIYDLSKDDQEVNNLAQQVPTVLERMRGELIRWMESFDPFEVNKENFRFQPDKSTEEQLRSLGYIQ
jgi:arylsulfatase A-like enzyme